MLHEHLQAHVVREDGLAIARGGRRAVHRRGHVRRRRVELRKEEARLAAALVADDVPRNGEAIDEEVLITRPSMSEQRLQRMGKRIT